MVNSNEFAYIDRLYLFHKDKINATDGEVLLRHRILLNDYFSIVAPMCVFDLAICNSITKGCLDYKG
jgi:hypothetical protein